MLPHAASYTLMLMKNKCGALLMLLPTAYYSKEKDFVYNKKKTDRPNWRRQTTIKTPSFKKTGLVIKFKNRQLELSHNVKWKKF